MLAQFQRQQAQSKLSKDVEDFKKSKLVWKDDVFKLAYDIFQEERGGQSGVEQHRERLKDLASKVKAATPKSGLAAMVQTLARYSAFEAYYATLPADQQKEAREERASVLKDVLEKNESNEVRLQLYDLYVDMGQYEEAGDALAEAANNNSGTDATSIRANAEIKDRLGKAEKAGKIEKAALDAVKKSLARWEKERIDEEKAQQEEQKSAKDVDKELEKLDDPAAKKAATTGGSAPKSESKK
jgi:hypothetical protein